MSTVYVVLTQVAPDRKVTKKCHVHAIREEAETHLRRLKKQGWKAEIWAISPENLEKFKAEKEAPARRLEHPDLLNGVRGEDAKKLREELKSMSEGF
jgi:hypothetical protein